MVDKRGTIKKILLEDDDLFLYQKEDIGVAVVFKLPPVRIAERFFNLIDNQVLSSWEAENIIWDNYVVFFEGEKDPIDMAKAIVASLIFFYSINLNTKYLGYKINKALEMSSTLSGTLQGVVVGAELAPYYKVKQFNAYDLYSNLLLAHGKMRKDINETISELSQKGESHRAPVSSASQPGAEEKREDTGLKGVPIEEGGMTGVGNFYKQVESADAARNSSAYKGIFKVLDGISSGKISPEKIEQMNPRMTIGGNKEIVGGKIVEDDDIVSAPLRQVKFSRRMPS